MENNILTSQRRGILIDRLWYGKSEIGHSFWNIHDHIDAYAALLSSLNLTTQSPKPILIGHSYGWPIVAGMALRDGNNLWWVISIAWTFDPELEKVYWISHWIKYQPLKLLSWPMIRVANNEKLVHAESLKTLTGWNSITVPVHLYHWTADSIVPYWNMQYALDQLPKATTESFVLTGKDHPLQFTDPKLFWEAITHMQQVLITSP